VRFRIITITVFCDWSLCGPKVHKFRAHAPSGDYMRTVTIKIFSTIIADLFTYKNVYQFTHTSLQNYESSVW